MRPIAEGVGVKGGGLTSASWATFLRLLFGVAGGGSIGFTSFAVLVVFAIAWIADSTCSSVDLRLRPRLAGIDAGNGSCLPLGTPSGIALLETRVDLLKDIVMVLSVPVLDRRGNVNRRLAGTDAPTN